MGARDGDVGALGLALPAEVPGDVSDRWRGMPGPVRGRSATLVVGLAVLVACGGGGSDAPAPGAAGDRRLLPQEVPAELRLCLVTDEPEDAPLPGEGQAVIWGDASLDDPWAGPLVLLSTKRDDHLPVHERAVAATIRGGGGYLAPAALFQAVSSAEYGHVATWFEEPGLVAEALVRGGTPDDARQTAEALAFDGDTATLPADQLGVDTRALSAGPFPSPLAVDRLSSWRASWMNMEAGRSLTVRGLVEVPDALELLRFLTVSSEMDTVGARQALVYSAFSDEGGPWGVAWREPDGLVVQVSGLGLQRQEMVAIAASVTDGAPGRWQELAGQTEDCSPAPQPPPPPGEG